MKRFAYDLLRPTIVLVLVIWHFGWASSMESWKQTKEKIQIPQGLIPMMKIIDNYELRTGHRFHIPSLIRDLQSGMDQLSPPTTSKPHLYNLIPAFDQLIDGMNLIRTDQSSPPKTDAVLIPVYEMNIQDSEKPIQRRTLILFKSHSSKNTQEPTTQAQDFFLADLEQVQIPVLEDSSLNPSQNEQENSPERNPSLLPARSIKDQLLLNQDFFESLSGNKFFIYQRNQIASLVQEHIQLQMDGSFLYSYLYPSFHHTSNLSGNISTEMVLQKIQTSQRPEHLGRMIESEIDLSKSISTAGVSKSSHRTTELTLPQIPTLERDSSYFEKILRHMKQHPQMYTDKGRFLSNDFQNQKLVQPKIQTIPQNTATHCPFTLPEDRISKWAVDGETIYVQMGYLDDPEHHMIESIDKAISYEIETRLLSPGCGVKKESMPWINAAGEEMEIPVFKWKKKYSDHIFLLQMILVPPATEKEIQTVPNQALNHRLQTFARDISSFVYFGHARHGKGMDILPFELFKAKFAEPIFSGSLAEVFHENQIRQIHILGCSAEEHLVKYKGRSIYKKYGIEIHANKSGAISFKNGIQQLFQRTLRFD